MNRVFANGPEDRGFTPTSSHTKDSQNSTWCHLAWHSALYGKDQSKVKQSREWSSALCHHLDMVAIEKRAFGGEPQLVSSNLRLLISRNKIITSFFTS